VAPVVPMMLKLVVRPAMLAVKVEPMVPVMAQGCCSHWGWGNGARVYGGSVQRRSSIGPKMPVMPMVEVEPAVVVVVRAVVGRVLHCCRRWWWLVNLPAYRVNPCVQTAQRVDDPP
jgi:hypothetical protein